jgi:hypothetical protein
MKLKSWLIVVVAALLLKPEYSKGKTFISECEVIVILTCIIIMFYISACNTEGDIRLADGQNQFEGRVEVCQGGQWRTVCDKDWDDSEAEVVCRQLGFSGDVDRKFM